MTACPKCGHDPGAPIAGSWTMLVDRNPLSLNAHVVNAGPSRFKYKAERDAWSWSIRAARLAWKVPKAKARRRVTLTRLYNGRQREWDRDNLVGGMKPIVDALVLEGLLLGDTLAGVELHHQQEKGPLRGLRIYIEELSA